MRLAALFLLLFTTSGDVLCSKFGWVWETLWIFKVARWTRDRCTKINTSPTVSSGVRASSFEIWTANLAQSLTLGTLTNSQNFILGVSNWKFCSQLPPDLTFRCRYFWLEEKKLCFYFCMKKIQTSAFTNWEKYEVSQNSWLVFIIDF